MEHSGRDRGADSRFRLFVFCLAAALCLLLIGSKSSPLYPMNDWVDVHCFFTVGRGIRHGLVPYRDLYEQKGPLLYALFYLAALISEDSFAGVFAIEVVCFALFLYESARTALLWTERKACLLFVPVLGLAVTVCRSFSHGSSAEELFLPVMVFSLRTVLRWIRDGEEKPLAGKQAFLLGLCAGGALWYKYTFAGFFIGLAACLVFLHIRRGQAAGLIRAAGGALAGMMGVTAAVAAWFGLAGGLPDLLQTYFADNLLLYRRETGMIGMIANILYGLGAQVLYRNWMWSVPAIAGVILTVIRRKDARTGAAAGLLSGGCLAVTVYAGGVFYPYYGLIFAAFGFAGLPAAAALIPAKGRNLTRRAAALAAAAVTAACAAGVYGLSENRPLMGTKREEMPQYAFAETIRAGGENARIANAYFLDSGFYYAAGLLPADRYFCGLNIKSEEINRYFTERILRGEYDYVITRDQATLPGNLYRRIRRQAFPYEGEEWIYYLFEKVPEPARE